MKNLFLPYNICVRLKEHGFNEGCLAYYTFNEKLTRAGSTTSNSDIQTVVHSDIFYSYCLAPLYQQVIEWFKTVHDIHIQPNFYENSFSKEMVYEYRVHYKTNESWRCIKISSSNDIDNSIIEALDLLKNKDEK